MSLENIYFVSSIIAAIGVTASLVFVGLQVRQSARTAKAEMQVSLMSEMPSLVMSWHLSERTRGVDPFGTFDFDALPSDLRGALMTFYWNYIKYLETCHYQLVHGFLDEEIWQSNVAPLAAMPEDQPLRQYWATRGMLFSPAFRAAVEDALVNHPQAAELRKLMQEVRRTTPDATEEAT